MSSTTSTPPGPPSGPPGPPGQGPPPGPPSGVSGGFAELVTFVDATGRVDGPNRLVSAMLASQQVINHLHGRLVELVQALHETYRDQILSSVLEPDEIAALTRPDGGLDLARSDLFEILDVETTLESLNEAQDTATRMTTLEVAAALGYTRREAAAMVRQRLTFSACTPTLVDAMTSGAVSLDKAVAIGNATVVLADGYAEAPHPSDTPSNGEPVTSDPTGTRTAGTAANNGETADPEATQNRTVGADPADAETAATVGDTDGDGDGDGDGDTDRCTGTVTGEGDGEGDGEGERAPTAPMLAMRSRPRRWLALWLPPRPALSRHRWPQASRHR